MKVKSLEKIKALLDGNLNVLKNEKWLMYLYLTVEKNVNFERFHSVKDISKNSVLSYVERTLSVLDTIECEDDEREIVEEVLKWSEVSKCGLPHKRKEWENKGYNLFVHNIGSSQIYREEEAKENLPIDIIKRMQIIDTLILTHGLIGQFIRGEVNLSENVAIKQLVPTYVSKEKLQKVLLILNRCIIKGISEKIYIKTKPEVEITINNILNGEWGNEYSVKERLAKLRSISIKNGENIEFEYRDYCSQNVEEVFEHIFHKSYLWYVESALSTFTFQEFVKIFMMTYKSINSLNIRHISFEYLMKDLFYDYKGKEKTVNLYKKRIIEKYLSDLSIEDILNNKVCKCEHVNFVGHIKGNDTICPTFDFSEAGTKLVEFCQEAEKSTLYEKGILLLYDLFGFRRDQYDRFNNEKNYLDTMNNTTNLKAVILDYIVGEKIVDLGPGGGGLMDLITETYTKKNVLGLDISTNVIEELKKKKQRESKSWDVMMGDVMELDKYIEEETVDTFIFCSIIHELFSYIPFEGIKFNHKTIGLALKNAFKTLKRGGRIIIRDGIMSEPKNINRIIKFKNKSDMQILKRYVNDFKGREIKYEKISDDAVRMNINDSMEFLYTYTWGEESYNHEVQEQFGYFTPSEYKSFIETNLGVNAKVILCKNYLQDGYTESLSEKIDYLNEKFESERLPDSTCLIVIEKA